MRTFYIFNINDEFATLTKDCPYNLFKSMEQIYYTDKKELDIAYNVYEQIIKPINKNKMNLDVFEMFKENDHYTKFNNTHMINNFYNDEQTRLVINSSFMLLKTTIAHPSFLSFFANLENVFVCDFENKDYFWTEKLGANACLIK